MSASGVNSRLTKSNNAESVLESNTSWPAMSSFGSKSNATIQASGFTAAVAGHCQVKVGRRSGIIACEVWLK